jgi:hypothetical protein
MLNLVLTGATLIFLLWLFGVSIHIGGSLLYLMWILFIMGIGYTLFVRSRAL